jgi:hypothetical protein
LRIAPTHNQRVINRSPYALLPIDFAAIGLGTLANKVAGIVNAPLAWSSKNVLRADVIPPCSFTGLLLGSRSSRNFSVELRILGIWALWSLGHIKPHSVGKLERITDDMRVEIETNETARQPVSSVEKASDANWIDFCVSSKSWVVVSEVVVVQPGLCVVPLPRESYR